jgi:hypothetical protein
VMQVPNSILNAATGIPEATFASLKSTYPLVTAPGTGGEECLARCNLTFAAVHFSRPLSLSPVWGRPYHLTAMPISPEYSLRLCSCNDNGALLFCYNNTSLLLEHPLPPVTILDGPYRLTAMPISPEYLSRLCSCDDSGALLLSHKNTEAFRSLCFTCLDKPFPCLHAITHDQPDLCSNDYV